MTEDELRSVLWPHIQTVLSGVFSLSEYLNESSPADEKLLVVDIEGQKTAVFLDVVFVSELGSQALWPKEKKPQTDRQNYRMQLTKQYGIKACGHILVSVYKNMNLSGRDVYKVNMRLPPGEETAVLQISTGRVERIL